MLAWEANRRTPRGPAALQYAVVIEQLQAEVDARGVPPEPTPTALPVREPGCRVRDKDAQQQLLLEVVRMYREQLAAGNSRPRVVIAEQLGYTPEHIGRLLVQARAADLLGEAAPGRAGELQFTRLARTRTDAASGRAQQLRRAAGMTQEEVAATIGVTRAAVALWEQGRRVPRGPAALRYAALLEQLEEVAARDAS